MADKGPTFLWAHPEKSGPKRGPQCGPLLGPLFPIEFGKFPSFDKTAAVGIIQLINLKNYYYNYYQTIIIYKDYYLRSINWIISTMKALH